MPTRSRTIGTRLFALSCALLLTSCGGDSGGTPSGPSGPDPATVVLRVDVNPGQGEADIGGTVQFAALATSQAGTPMSGIAFAWTSSNPSVATVDNGGLATALGAGTATITATAQGISGTAQLVVTDPNPPSAPSGVEATTLSDTEILVSWTDNSSNETGFQIFREEVGAGSTAGPTKVFAEAGTVGANVTSFTDTGLNPGSSYRYAVQACNDNGCTEAPEGSDDTTTNQTLVLETEDIGDGVVGEPYSAQLEATGGDGSFAWSVASGALPGGLSLGASTGLIDGTPDAPGPFAFVIEVTAGDGQVDAQLLDITVTEAPVAPEVITEELPNGLVGTPYSQVLAASGGDGSFSWALTGGALPSGLQLDPATGGISGTPTAEGASSFQVTVTSAELTGTADLSIAVFEPLEVTTGADLPSAIIGDPYTTSLAASGGDGSFTWERTSGSLPDGLSLSSAGEISGTATTAEEGVFTARVTSGDGQTAEREFTLRSQEGLGITTSSLPNGVVGITYSQTLMASGAQGPVTWSVTGGALPDGLALAPGTGIISGTPAAAEASSFEITANDGVEVATRDLSIGTFDLLAISTDPIPSAIVGEPYSTPLTATGGDGVNSWSVESGALPDGLALDPTSGVLSGTPTAAGLADFTAGVSSGDGQSAATPFELTVADPLEITTESMPDGETETPYGTTLASNGGVEPITWAVTDGVLPAGVALNSETGEVSGTPTAGGDFMITAQASSSDGQTAEKDFTFTIIIGVTITTTTLPDGLLDQPYSETVVATGGDGTFAFSVSSGALPDGLSLDAGSGAISGTPTAAGDFTFTITAESAGASDSQAYAVSITTPPVSLARTYLGTGSPGEAFSAALEASGGDGTFAFTIIEGALPAGLSLAPSTGVISGTPTSPGAAFLRVQVASDGTTASELFTITVSNNPSSGFNLTVHNVAGSIPSADIMASLDDALARWEQIVTADLPEATFGANYFPGGNCSPGGSEFNNESVDDMVVFINISNIDGPGSILGSAGPCWLRDHGGLEGFNVTSAGSLTLDSSDIGGWDATRRFNVIWHEIGHIFGIGTLWTQPGNVLRLAAEYIGTEGVNQYQNIGGTRSSIEVEADGGGGTAFGHWDEIAFDDEMMTGYAPAPGVAAPISAFTIGSLQDLGYTVDVSQDDGYVVPVGALRESEPGERLFLGPDIRLGPIMVQYPDGTVGRFEPRRR